MDLKLPAFFRTELTPLTLQHVSSDEAIRNASCEVNYVVTWCPVMTFFKVWVVAALAALALVSASAMLQAVASLLKSASFLHT